MGKLIFALFEGAFKHVGSFFEHVHFPEWLIPRVFFQLIRRTYDDNQTFWDGVGIAILVFIAVYFVLKLVKKKPGDTSV